MLPVIKKNGSSARADLVTPFKAFQLNAQDNYCKGPGGIHAQQPDAIN
jgi:hypothetical protein